MRRHAGDALLRAVCSGPSYLSTVFSKLENYLHLYKIGLQAVFVHAVHVVHALSVPACEGLSQQHCTGPPSKHLLLNSVAHSRPLYTAS